MNKLLVIALICAGCATAPQKPWYKDGLDIDQFNRDVVTCRQYGFQATTQYRRNSSRKFWGDIAMEECMTQLGYRR